MKTDEFVFSSNEHQLAGQMDIPDGPGPHPAMIMVHGTGPTDAKNFYLRERKSFTEASIACVAWDKPGCGQSTGEFDFHQSWRERAREVLDVIDILKHREDIDDGRIGLWGFSQGSWICFMSAVRSTDIAFLIIVSGAGKTAIPQGIYLLEQNLNLDEPDKDKARDMITAFKKSIAYGMSGGTYEDYLEISRPLHDNEFLTKFGINRVTREEFDNPNIRINGVIDAEILLEFVKCPFLAIFGEKDMVINWRKSVEVYRRSLQAGGNRDFEIVTFEGANHIMNQCVTGSFMEMITSLSSGTQPVPGYLEKMIDWLKERGVTRVLKAC